MRYPQWFLLLVAVLGILSGCRSSRDLEAFAKQHREALNQALVVNFKHWPSRVHRPLQPATHPQSDERLDKSIVPIHGGCQRRICTSGMKARYFNLFTL